MDFLSSYDYDISRSVKWGYFFFGIIVGVLLMGVISIFIIVSSPRFEVSEYEGMTCISNQNGLTCNWAEWKGEAR